MQIFQRDSKNMADIRIAGMVPPGTGLVEAKADLDGKLRGKAVDWTIVAAWKDVKDGKFSGTIRLATGGWYSLRVRFRKSSSDKQVIRELVVSKVGVGDIFVVAGQSNSANHGERLQAPKSGLVVNFMGSKWRPANDPQSGATGNGGSFIPPFGDAIAEKLRMPVGFVTCGFGGTSVREWLPKGATFETPPDLKLNVTKISDKLWASKGTFYDMMIGRMKPLGTNGFRAVLWHQGETDADFLDSKKAMSSELYSKYLEKIISQSRKDTGWEVPWFVAQVSYHTQGQEELAGIRGGQKALWDRRIALEGPDTDALKSEFREKGGKGIHFSDKGLREHGARWAEKVGNWLEKNYPVE